MNLESLRKNIDTIDDQILDLFLKRLKCCEKIADIKIKSNIPILNEEREKEILNHRVAKSENYSEETKQLFSEIMSISRDIQYKIIKS